VAEAGGPAPSPEVQPVAQPAVGPQNPAPALPALQFTRDHQVTLEYEVTKFGPSGVGSVEVYITRDDGQSWQLYGAPQTVSLPVPTAPADPKNSPTSLRRSVTVNLPNEGVYGFYLVVKSGAGLGKPAPRNGTPPQIRVELDTTPPKAKLYELVPEPGSHDSLVITWTATDQNLVPKVLLEWAEQHNGRWEPIGGGELPNTGRYSWQLPPGVPPQVYLRLTVRDAAGNVSVAQTAKPILIDLNQPEVANVNLHVGTAP
jgi:hypothetical protein